MIERTLNLFWILLGAAAAAYAWTLGLVGPSGPESGLFPFISAMINMGAGVVVFTNMLAVGQVRTSFLLEASSSTGTRRGAPPKAAPPAKAAPAPKGGAARLAEPPPVQSPSTVATADRMTFIDAQRKAVYAGDAVALATLKGPDSDVVARDITLTLASDQRVLSTLEASGQMSAKFEGGREAVGDQLTYDAVSETHVIKGRPMYFKNVQNDANSKKSCTLEKYRSTTRARINPSTSPAPTQRRCVRRSRSPARSR